MLTWIGKHAVVLAAGGAFAYWFFTGTTPVALAKGLVGNGRKLARHHLDGEGRVIEPIDELRASAAGVLGQSVSEDAYRLAAVSASEHAYASPKEKALIQRVVMNRVRAWEISMSSATTNGKGMGKQSGGRPVSTVNGPWELDYVLATQNLSGELADDSLGALYFVHATGFKRVTDYDRVCAKWYDERQIVPIDVGGVSSLRIFIPEERAIEEGLA